MANVLYYGLDDRLPRIVESFFKTRKEDSGESNTITHIQEDKKLEEALQALSFEIMFIEQAHLPGQPNDWRETFKKKYPRANGKMILVGDDHEPLKIIKYLDVGWVDYIVNPPDKPLIIEKVGLYATGARSRDMRQVYSLNMSQNVDLAKPGFIEELSEFDCKVRTGQINPVEDIMVLYSKAFGPNFEDVGYVVARCYKSEPHAQFKNQYLNHYFFVGVMPDTLQNIRTALRKAYVSSKSK